jgi:hypothetical protein
MMARAMIKIFPTPLESCHSTSPGPEPIFGFLFRKFHLGLMRLFPLGKQPTDRNIENEGRPRGLYENKGQIKRQNVTSR